MRSEIVAAFDLGVISRKRYDKLKNRINSVGVAHAKYKKGSKNNQLTGSFETRAGETGNLRNLFGLILFPANDTS